MTKAEILGELRELKEKKCKLETAHEKGWLNADRRLEELHVYISDRLQALEEGGAATPWMGCGPEPTAEQMDDGFHEQHKKFWLKEHGEHKAKSGAAGVTMMLIPAAVVFGAALSTTFVAF